MSLPSPPKDYDQRDQQTTRAALEQMDNQNRKLGQDVEMGPKGRVIISSPSGARWALVASDAGALTLVAVTN